MKNTLSLFVLYFSEPANIVYFLITVDGTTYNQTMINNLLSGSIFLSTIQQENEKLLCPEKMKTLLLEHSIQDFYVHCSNTQM